MFICFLPRRPGMSIAIGIVDVLFVQADAVKTQGSVSPSVDLTVGLCLLVFGTLVVTDPRRAAAHAHQGGQKPELVGSDARPAVARAHVRDRRAGRDARASISGLNQLVRSNDRAGVPAVGVFRFA